MIQVLIAALISGTIGFLMGFGYGVWLERKDDIEFADLQPLYDQDTEPDERGFKLVRVIHDD